MQQDYGKERSEDQVGRVEGGLSGIQYRSAGIKLKI